LLRTLDDPFALTQPKIEKTMSFASKAIASILLILAVTGCTKDVPIVETKGPCVDVYKSPVCTWAKTQGDRLLEVGAVVPIGSIENSPAEMPMEWPPVPIAVLDIPEVAHQKSGLTHFTMYWEVSGHPPGTYMTPHFDFHFNRIASAERNAFGCSDTSKPTALPSAYALPDIPLPPEMAKMMGVPALIGLCVPKMGMHAIPASDLDAKEPFRASMVIGYAHGKPIFVEPMVAKAMLMEKKPFDLVIPQIPGLTGAHPTKFHADYDAGKQEYRLIFSDFSAPN
jgi:hypothetical protein